MQEMVTYFVGLARENNNTFPAGKYEAYSIYNYAPVYTARVDPDNASCTTLTTHLKLSSLALYIHTHTHAHPGNNLTIGLFVRYTKRVDTLASLSTTSQPLYWTKRVSPLTCFSLLPSPVSHLFLPNVYRRSLASLYHPPTTPLSSPLSPIFFSRVPGEQTYFFKSSNESAVQPPLPQPNTVKREIRRDLLA